MAETEASIPASTGSKMPASRGEERRHPLATLRDEMDRLFDDFFSGSPLMPLRRRDWGLAPWRRLPASYGATLPGVDIADSEKEYRITAELPGVEEKDVDVSLADDVLTIKGEKRHERKEKTEDYVVSERRFGSFERSFTLPLGADAEKIDATFKSGVLTITVPKLPEAQAKRKKISVKAS